MSEYIEFLVGRVHITLTGVEAWRGVDVARAKEGEGASSSR